MNTQDLIISLNYYVMNAKKAASYLSTQPDADVVTIKRVESLLKTVQSILETPERLSSPALSTTLDFSEAKERSVAP
tara:strand:+ start:4717 stop:4947 length:231 start_codon:yes stop_codon:yes gene_type:complete